MCSHGRNKVIILFLFILILMLVSCSSDSLTEDEEVVLSVGIHSEEGGEVWVNDEVVEPGEELVFAKGSSVLVTAQSTEGYKFTGWEIGDFISYDSEIELDLFEDTTILAGFRDKEEEIEVKLNHPPQGAIIARVEEEIINSGEMIKSGQDVEFELFVSDYPYGYEIDSWQINEKKVKDENEFNYLHKNLNKDIEVSVELQETDFFAVEINEVNSRISEKTGEKEIEFNYKVTNKGLKEGNQKINFVINGEPVGSQNVNLSFGESFTDNFIYDLESENKEEYSLELVSENDNDEIKVQVEYISTEDFEVDVIWDLPPEAPEKPWLNEIKREGKKEILISWEEVKKADEYNLVRQQTDLGQEGDWRVIGTTRSLLYLDDEIEPDRKYRYAVVAVRGRETSDYSQFSEEILLDND